MDGTSKHLITVGLAAGGACAALLGTALWRQHQELDKLKQANRRAWRRSFRAELQLSKKQQALAAAVGSKAPADPSERSTQPQLDDFHPHHITASSEDMAGNGSTGGRYFLLPGSNSRAVVMATMLEEGSVTVRKSSRGHDVHLGQLSAGNGRFIDIGICATGMGCPSVDIIVTELIKLGARRFLRVGTSGSLQPHTVRVGDVVVATAAVRDEGTSRHYVPLEFPAVASNSMVQALQQAATECADNDDAGADASAGAASLSAASLSLACRTYCGVIHTKDSLYAREFGEGALASTAHKQYMRLLKRMGVLASEMEASHLFTLAHAQAHACPSRSITAISPISAVNNAANISHGTGPIECGAVLAVVGDDSPFADPTAQALAVKRAIALSLQGIRVMHRNACRRSTRGKRSHLQLRLPDAGASVGDACGSP